MMQKEGTEKKETLKDKVWKHRKLIIGGAILVGCAAAIYMNRDLIISALFGSGEEAAKIAIDAAGKSAVDKIAADTTIGVAEDAAADGASKIIKISLHIRKLPNGYKPSPEKIAEAVAMGIELMPGYTLVDDYTKTMAA